MIEPPMTTEKIYWSEPTRLELSTTGAIASTFQGRASIVLPRTVFYPEGGGQLGDRGNLAIGGEDVPVIDTQIDDDGRIHHLVEREVTMDPSATITLRVEAVRRHDQTAHHTAQHMLSRALLDIADAATVSARLGTSSATIDVDVAALGDDALAAAEDRVNEVIRADVTVRAFFPTAEELPKLDLRRAPKVTTGVRIVAIDGFDLTPCGGTHCTRSGQIGTVRIQSIERYKGKLRVDFVAAHRAALDARHKDRVLQALAATFSCGALDVPGAVEKLRADLKHRDEALVAARGELAVLVAQHELASHPPDPSGTTVVVVRRDAGDVGFLRTLANRLTQRDDVVAICTARDGDADLVVVQRGARASFDCGSWLKAKATSSGGRGGGRPERAEGRLPPHVALP